MGDVPDANRAAEVQARLARVRRRIAVAAEASGRARAPELIVVTKFFPVEDVRLLAALGVRDVGENRDQEAARKAAGTRNLDLHWHFIGQLQTNKARSVVKYAHAVHSVDRMLLVDALGRAVAAEQERRTAESLGPRPALRCFVQVNLAGLDGPLGKPRGGADPHDVQALADRIAATGGLVLAGVMGVAPLRSDPWEAFRRLGRISAAVAGVHPGAGSISAGMSGDLEAAVAAGATHLRIGSDVLGERPALR